MSIEKATIVANLSFLFLEKPFMERFAEVKKAGLGRVEFMFPYDYNVAEMVKELASHGLELVQFNLPAGNWERGERGIAVDPRRKDEFRSGVTQALDMARKLKVSQLNCLVGKILPEVDPQELRSTLIHNIRYAADKLHREGIRLLLEPLNHFDAPGFYLNTTEEVLQLIAEVDHENVYLQYDLYHAAREGEDLLQVLHKALPKIGHIQIADNPGRHQPGTGEIDYKQFFDTLKKVGYSKAVSMEYIPNPSTLASLQWIKDFE